LPRCWRRLGAITDALTARLSSSGDANLCVDKATAGTWMKSTGAWAPKSDFTETFGKFLDDLFPGFDEREHYMTLVGEFLRGGRKKLKIDLKEVSFMKLFCDAYFLKEIRTKELEEREGKAPRNVRPTSKPECRTPTPVPDN